MRTITTLGVAISLAVCGCTASNPAISDDGALVVDAGRDGLDASGSDAVVDAYVLPDSYAEHILDARPAMVPDADARPDATVADAAFDTASAAPDAEVDPGCLGAVVTVGDVEVFAYEASRSDSSADSAGSATDRACSKPGVLPWATITLDQARAACTASGFALCTGEDWLAVCSGDAHRAFPYGGSHVPAACNDPVSGDAHVEVGGFHPDCHTPEGVYDMSGNLWEMTDDGQRRGASFRINPAHYQTEVAQCDGQLTIIGDGANDENGFRCCRRH